MKYLIRTAGCQMNEADSRRVASELEKLGLDATSDPESADVIVLNTCVVRQSAEDKAYGWLTALQPLKTANPDKVINLMGCLVGVKGNSKLQSAFPFVDVFSPPSDPGPLVQLLRQREGYGDREAYDYEAASLATRYAVQDGDLKLPERERGSLISAHVPVVYGCSHGCTFCIIPFRRGIERSRPVGDIAREVRALAEQGVKEITLLGQIVDRYGKDVPDGPNLAALLRAIHEVDGVERIRFLTSHPNWMTDELLDTVAELPKVCEHIEVPVQAGDDEVLQRMKRGYTADDYRRLVERIRARIPNVSIATDIIVGFPGESEAQFQQTYDLLAELKLDVIHIAKYSTRPQTVADRTLPDDVPEAEKERRRKALDEQQAEVTGEINTGYLGQTVEVLVEDRHKDKWRGRTRTNKLVFFDDGRDWKGRLANVTVTRTGPWSMQAEAE
jgi:tRNA-2-methylthio-N6-dimethylallyladenosine synthase